MEICILKFSGTRVLPRGSSALVLVATPDVNDQLVRLFEAWSPEVIRRDVAEEVAQRLHALQRKVLAAQQQQVSP